MTGEGDLRENPLFPKEILPIRFKEFAEIVQDSNFLERLFVCAGITLSTPNESGFVVGRGMIDGKRYFSDAKTGDNRSFEPDKVEFPDFPDEQKGVINTQPEGTKFDPNSRDNWPLLDISVLHFHPQRRQSETDVGWFELSPLDFIRMNSDNVVNALKLRVSSGIPSGLLRSLDPPEGNSELEKLAQSIHHFYGYLYKGMFAKRMENPTSESIEAEYRVFSCVAMAISRDKVQILVLNDDPGLSRNEDQGERPKVFNEEPRWLKDDKGSCQEIVDFYRGEGYFADIVFFERQNNYVTVNWSFSQNK